MKYFAFLLLFVCVIAYTQAATVRTADDIRKYEEFLRNSAYGLPQAPVLPELQEIQPAWERSGAFESDIILTEEQIQSLVDEYSGVKNAVKNQLRRWPNGNVFYEINPENFTEQHVEAIQQAIDYVEKNSCLVFNEKSDEDENYISITGGPIGCRTTVGYVGKGSQGMNLTPAPVGENCFVNGTIVHELLHALGFYHMHSTHNRDEFIEVVWDNIIKSQESDYVKHSAITVTNLDTIYDYGSVMHYSRRSNSINGGDTLVPLKDTTAQLGQRFGMSKTDILKLNRLYDCPEKEINN